MRFFRKTAIGLSIVALTLPVAFVATFLLMPLWSAIESSTRIESVGHSGPADWCFIATWAASLGLAIGAAVVVRRSRTRASASAGETSSLANAARDSSPQH